MTVKLVLGWALASVLGWLWWRYFKTGVAASKAGKYERVKNPFLYWLTMAIHTLLTAIVAGAVIAGTMEALGF